MAKLAIPFAMLLLLVTIEAGPLFIFEGENEDDMQAHTSNRLLLQEDEAEEPEQGEDREEQEVDDMRDQSEEQEKQESEAEDNGDVAQEEQDDQKEKEEQDAEEKEEQEQAEQQAEQENEAAGEPQGEQQQQQAQQQRPQQQGGQQGQQGGQQGQQAGGGGGGDDCPKPGAPRPQGAAPTQQQAQQAQQEQEFAENDGSGMPVPPPPPDPNAVFKLVEKNVRCRLEKQKENLNKQLTSLLKPVAKAFVAGNEGVGSIAAALGSAAGGVMNKLNAMGSKLGSLANKFKSGIKAARNTAQKAMDAEQAVENAARNTFGLDMGDEGLIFGIDKADAARNKAAGHKLHDLALKLADVAHEYGDRLGGHYALAALHVEHVAHSLATVALETGNFASEFASTHGWDAAEMSKIDTSDARHSGISALETHLDAMDKELKDYQEHGINDDVTEALDLEMQHEISQIDDIADTPLELYNDSEL